MCSSVTLCLRLCKSHTFTTSQCIVQSNLGQVYTDQDAPNRVVSPSDQLCNCQQHFLSVATMDACWKARVETTAITGADVQSMFLPNVHTNRFFSCEAPSFSFCAVGHRQSCDIDGVQLCQRTIVQLKLGTCCTCCWNISRMEGCLNPQAHHQEDIVKG